jgi:uncharacterized protein (DUF2384 family)
MENLQKIIDSATEVLGSEARARDWIEKHSSTLGDSPRSLSATEEGTKAVLLHLASISRHNAA